MSLKQLDLLKADDMFLPFISKEYPNLIDLAKCKCFSHVILLVKKCCESKDKEFFKSIRNWYLDVLYPLPNNKTLTLSMRCLAKAIKMGRPFAYSHIRLTGFIKKIFRRN